jgi:glycosyl transferase family 25
MDRIDKFIYLNLDSREDRKKHLLSELKKFGIPEEKIIRFSAIKKEKGALGCSLSHMKMMKMFKESKDKVWCILEDDHYFLKSLEETNEYINKFIDNTSYDVLMGCTCGTKCGGIGDKLLMRVHKACMTSFFIVKDNMADALIASHKNSARSYSLKGGTKGIPCDIMWHHLMKIFVFVTPITGPLGAQLHDYSDIRKKNVNYTTNIKVKIDRKLEDIEKEEKEE